MSTLQVLREGDASAVLDVLFQLGGEREVEPSDAHFEAIVALFDAPDRDVRERAIFAASLHWAWRPSFDVLLQRLLDETDADLQVLLAASIMRMGTAYPALIPRAGEALRGFIRRPDRAEMPRRQAYRSFLRLTDQITRDAYRRAFSTSLAIDLDVLNAWRPRGADSMAQGER